MYVLLCKGGVLLMKRFNKYRFPKIVLSLLCFLNVLTIFSGCNSQSSIGCFYSLQESVNAGFLSIDDLKNIAYNLSHEIQDENFAPTTYSLEELDREIIKKIKETRLLEIRKAYNALTRKATLNDIQIISYLGTYNGCVAVILTDSYNDYPAAMREIVIENVRFKYSNGNDIQIWKDK